MAPQKPTYDIDISNKLNTTLILKLFDGTYQTIRINSISHITTFTVLCNHYADRYKVSKLMDLGDVDFLGMYIESQPDLDNRQFGGLYTRAYIRDLLESYNKHKPVIYNSLKEVLTKVKTKYYYMYNNRYHIDHNPNDPNDFSTPWEIIKPTMFDQDDNYKEIYI